MAWPCTIQRPAPTAHRPRSAIHHGRVHLSQRASFAARAGRLAVAEATPDWKRCAAPSRPPQSVLGQRARSLCGPRAAAPRPTQELEKSLRWWSARCMCWGRQSSIVNRQSPVASRQAPAASRLLGCLFQNDRPCATPGHSFAGSRQKRANYFARNEVSTVTTVLGTSVAKSRARAAG